MQRSMSLDRQPIEEANRSEPRADLPYQYPELTAKRHNIATCAHRALKALVLRSVAVSANESLAFNFL